MKSKRIQKVLASLLMTSMIVSSSATAFAVTPKKYLSAASVYDILSNLTQEQREALEQLEATADFKISPDINLNSSEEVSVIVQFKQDPAKVEVLKERIKGKSLSLYSAEAKVEESHNKFKQDLNTIKRTKDSKLVDAKINLEFKQAFNGVAMTISANAVEELLKSDMVKTVWKDYEIKLDLPEIEKENDLNIDQLMHDSIPYIGVDELHKENITGKGIKVGVLDTGIDYNHPDLTSAYKGYRLKEEEDPSTVDPSTVRGWDFIDNDADPMEATYEDWENSKYYPWLPYEKYITTHGTHVSGTISGQAENDVDHAVKGVAPDADLYVYRVLGPQGGTTGTVIGGIDKAVADEMDVINLSLGATINNPLYPTSIAINNAVLSGVVACVAAGNSGPSDFTLGSPGTAALAITVGASDVARDVVGVDCIIDNEDFDLKSFYKSSEELEKELEGKNLSVEYVGLGSEKDFAGKDLTGKIALIQRGELMFVDKMANAKNAGAAAVIIFNNVDGILGFHDEEADIVTFSMTKEEGEEIKSQLENGQEVHITFGEFGTVRTEGDYLAGFSSRGPVRYSYDIKPDIVAPGVQIFSTYPENYFDPEEGENYDIAYKAIDGTSMATPHMAGIAALMLQKNPEYTPFDVKTAMMNTSEDLNSDYSVYEEGAGRVNAYEAVHTDVLIKVLDKSYSVSENDEVIEIDDITGSISFGRFYKDGSSIVDSREVTIINNDSEDKEFELNVEFNSIDVGAKDAVSNGVTFDIPTTIAVNTNDTVKFEPTITVPNSAEVGTYEGYIRLVNKNDTKEEYQIPFAIKIVEKGIDYIGLDRNAICPDTYFLQPLLYPMVNGYYKFRSPMKTIDLVIKDGKTSEPLGIIGSNPNASNLQIDVEYFNPSIFTGTYQPFTGDQENPVGEWTKLPEGHYKLALIGTDEDGNVYEVSDDIVIDTTPPEVTFDKEPGLYQITEDILTEEEDSEGVTHKALWIHGTIHDSTIDYLNEIGRDTDFRGNPIDQSKNMIEYYQYYQHSYWPTGYFKIKEDGSFKFGIAPEEVEEIPQQLRMVFADYGTAGLLKNQYRYTFIKPDEERMGLKLNKDEITNNEEFTVTLNLNNVTEFIGGGAQIHTYDRGIYEFVKAEINPEFEKFAKDNGLEATLLDSEITSQSWDVRADLKAAEGNELKGFTGSIPFIDVTLKYTGGYHLLINQLNCLDAKYSVLGQEDLKEISSTPSQAYKVREQYSLTGGYIQGEAYKTVNGWLNKKIDFSNVKVFAEAPNGERYEGTIDERGYFMIYDLPIIEQDYKMVLESPGHFYTYRLNDLYRRIDGELVAVNRSTFFNAPLAGDVNSDNVIDILDAIEVYDNYGKYETIVEQDLNLDGSVDDIDMSYIYKNFMAVNNKVDVTVTPKDELEGRKLDDMLKYLQDKGIFVGNISAEDGFVPGENVSVQVRIHNFASEEAQNVALILALYDENNKLIDFVKKETIVTTGPDRGYMQNLKTTLQTTEEGYTVKCFVWNSLDNLEPLVKVFEIPVMNN